MMKLLKAIKKTGVIIPVVLFLYLFSAYNSAMFLRDSFTAGTVTFIDLLLSQLNDINSICFAVMLPFLLLILSDETGGERVLTSIKRGALISAIALMLLIMTVQVQRYGAVDG